MKHVVLNFAKCKLIQLVVLNSAYTRFLRSDPNCAGFSRLVWNCGELMEVFRGILEVSPRAKPNLQTPLSPKSPESALFLEMGKTADEKGERESRSRVAPFCSRLTQPPNLYMTQISTSTTLSTSFTTPFYSHFSRRHWLGPYCKEKPLKISKNRPGMDPSLTV